MLKKYGKTNGDINEHFKNKVKNQAELKLLADMF